MSQLLSLVAVFLSFSHASCLSYKFNSELNYGFSVKLKETFESYS